MPRKKVEVLENGILINSIRPTIEEVERGVEFAAAKLEIKGLPRVIALVQTKGKKKNCMGAFTDNIWSTREGEMFCEITLSAEALQRDPIDILSTVFHESLHLANYARNALGEKHPDYQKLDTGKSGRHNKIFRDNAVAFGFEVADDTDSYGYGYTTPSPEMRTMIEEEFVPDMEKLNLFRITMPARETAPTKNKKWECGDGCFSFRCAKDITAMCTTCNTPFVKAEEAPEDGA